MENDVTGATVKKSAKHFASDSAVSKQFRAIFTSCCSRKWHRSKALQEESSVYLGRREELILLFSGIGCNPTILIASDF
jgi:hypothetical protein